MRDLISRQAAIKACGGYLVPANIIRELPPVQPEIVPCDYVKACKEATRNSPIDVYVYRNALAELKELGYVLVDVRGNNMTYKELYESAVDKLEKSKITLGEFERMIKPLNAEVATDINVGDKDTISRKAAIDGKICIRRSNGVEIYDDYVVPVEYLEQLPPAQPEIIRCRNCKFASGDSRICMKFGHSPIGELDFCAWAERRTDEE